MSAQNNTYSLLIVHDRAQSSSISDAFDQWVLENGGELGTRARLELPDLQGFKLVAELVSRSCQVSQP